MTEATTDAVPATTQGQADCGIEPDVRGRAQWPRWTNRGLAITSDPATSACAPHRRRRRWPTRPPASICGGSAVWGHHVPKPSSPRAHYPAWSGPHPVIHLGVTIVPHSREGGKLSGYRLNNRPFRAGGGFIPGVGTWVGNHGPPIYLAQAVCTAMSQTSYPWAIAAAGALVPLLAGSGRCLRPVRPNT